MTRSLTASRHVLCGTAFLFLVCLPIDGYCQYVERIDVSIANIDVVVTDRGGRPVRGLTKDDFEVFESGRLQTITNFALIEAAAEPPSAVAGSTAPQGMPATQRPRLIVLFVDIDDIDPLRRKQFFDGVRRFVHATLRKNDFMTVLSWNHRVRIVAEPTSDGEHIDRIIDAFAAPYGFREGAAAREAGELRVEQAGRDARVARASGLEIASDPASEASFMEWVIGEERCANIRRKAMELRTVVASLARIDMQKAVIFASDDMALMPTGTCDTSIEQDALAATANAYGVTIHAFHPPGARDRIIGPERGGFLPGANARSFFEEASGLARLARKTGGLMGAGPQESAQLLEQVAGGLDTYYSIGYRMSPGNEDRLRSVKVRTKNRSYRVRARQSVVRLSETTRIRDQVTTNLYLPEPSEQQTPFFDARISSITRDGRFRLVHVELEIRARDLAFLPVHEGKRSGSFSVFVAAGREVGDASQVREMKQELELTASSPDEVVTYSFATRIRPDSRRLSIAVRDNVSGSIATRLVSLSTR
ncbi:MAG TPA: VWA domain-containing protein [Thermoanaerobaculia bacterium]|nr:VWA domain-containing protein [Thermoanaerobaculia bacterium]